MAIELEIKWKEDISSDRLSEAVTQTLAALNNSRKFTIHRLESGKLMELAQDEALSLGDNWLLKGEKESWGISLLVYEAWNDEQNHFENRCVAAAGYARTKEEYLILARLVVILAIRNDSMIFDDSGLWLKADRAEPSVLDEHIKRNGIKMFDLLPI